MSLDVAAQFGQDFLSQLIAASTSSINNNNHDSCSVLENAKLEFASLATSFLGGAQNINKNFNNENFFKGAY